jgi:hypothetical protein
MLNINFFFLNIYLKMISSIYKENLNKLINLNEFEDVFQDGSKLIHNYSIFSSLNLFGSKQNLITLSDIIKCSFYHYIVILNFKSKSSYLNNEHNEDFIEFHQNTIIFLKKSVEGLKRLFKYHEYYKTENREVLFKLIENIEKELSILCELNKPEIKPETENEILIKSINISNLNTISNFTKSSNYNKNIQINFKKKIQNCIITQQPIIQEETDSHDSHDSKDFEEESEYEEEKEGNQQEHVHPKLKMYYESIKNCLSGTIHFFFSPINWVVDKIKGYGFSFM